MQVFFQTTHTGTKVSSLEVDLMAIFMVLEILWFKREVNCKTVWELAICALYVSQVQTKHSWPYCQPCFKYDHIYFLFLLLWLEEVIPESASKSSRSNWFQPGNRRGKEQEDGRDGGSSRRGKIYRNAGNSFAGSDIIPPHWSQQTLSIPPWICNGSIKNILLHEKGNKCVTWLLPGSGRIGGVNNWGELVVWTIGENIGWKIEALASPYMVLCALLCSTIP